MRDAALWSASDWAGRIIRVLAVTLCVSSLGGCAFARGAVGPEFGQEEAAALASLKKGLTTRAEVAAQFGAPDEIIAGTGREIYHYRRFEAKFGLVLIFSRVNVASDNLYVLFDREGIVEEVIFGKRTGGLEFQVWPFGD